MQRDANGRVLPAMVAVLLAIHATCAGAHPGGLNREGCHNDRKNGGYHCHRGATPAPRQDFAPPREPAKPPDRDRAFRNCDEARAAGAAPVRRGDPGYGPHLDRDNDGIGCEPYRGR